MSKSPQVSSHAMATAWVCRTYSSTLRPQLGHAWTLSSLDFKCGAALDRHSKCRKMAQMGLSGFCLMWQEGFRNKNTPLVAVGWMSALAQHLWREAQDCFSQHHTGNGDFLELWLILALHQPLDFSQPG